MEVNKIYNENCLKTLKRFEDNSIDIVITSPPYNMNLRIRNGSYCSRQIVKEFSTKYEGFDDNLPIDEFYELHSNIIRELLRVSGIIFYNIQIVTELILIFEKENAISRKFSKFNFERGTLGDIWNISRGKKVDKSHGAVFPEKLVSTILNNFSNEGDIVYDPFMGSGTTAVVSQKLNRKWLGSELSPNYCELIQKRIDEVQGGLV